MYCRKAALCHRHRAWMVESSTPARAADVAAPIRKLCPVYSFWEKLREERMSRTCFTSQALVTGACLASIKNGPGRYWLDAMNATTAATGQTAVSVRPTITSTPFPNWSHLERFRWTLTIVGADIESTATSPHERQKAESYLARENPPGALLDGRSQRMPNRLRPRSAPYPGETTAGGSPAFAALQHGEG